MAMVFRIDPGVAAPADSPVRLSGRVMGQLGPAEQLVIWAFRELAAPHEPGSADRLRQGFDLAFGARLRGPAACGFDGVRRVLAGARDPRFCPLRCACLSVDESRLLHALAAAQLGDRSWHCTLAAQLVEEHALAPFWRQSRLLGAVLSAARFILPDARLVGLEATGTRH